MQKNQLSPAKSKDHPYKFQILSSEQISSKKCSHKSTHKKTTNKPIDKKKMLKAIQTMYAKNLVISKSCESLVLFQIQNPKSCHKNVKL